jgi:hypothetical protein
MNPTIYAAFESADEAKRAIGALIRGGTAAADITLACKNLSHQVQAGDLNPAQDDYPRSGGGATELSSAPSDSPRDYNKGIEADDYNSNYKGDVDRDIQKELGADRQRANELGPESDRGVGPTTIEAYARMPDPIFETRGSEPAKLDEDDQEFGAMPGTFPDLRAQGPGNSSGDPSMAAPGMRFASIAATANAAANPGGMTDYLWDSLPVDTARIYQQEYDGGKAIVIVRTPSAAAEQILRDQGALHVQRQGYLA